MLDSISPDIDDLMAGQGTVLIGRGEHTYEAVHDYLQPPSHIRWGNTHGLAQDSAGRIYVAHTVHPTSPCRDAIAVFNEDGRFLTSWGARFQGGAHGLDIRREDGPEYLYHCDTRRKLVIKTTLGGEVVWEMGQPAESGAYGAEDAFVPTNTAFAPNGDFYVTDGYGADWIHQFDADGNFLRTFGGRDLLSNAHGIFVDERGQDALLAVADRGNGRIRYFSLDGRALHEVRNGLRQPCHFDSRGDLLLVPDLCSVLHLLDRENRTIARLGDGHPSSLRDAPRSAFIPGRFIHPHDAIFLRNGDILVAEWVPIGRITLLRKLGSAESHGQRSRYGLESNRH